jgi:hypothetical protein
VLFRVETGPGAHSGPSGRLARLDAEAEVMAFVLDKLAGPPGPPGGDRAVSRTTAEGRPRAGVPWATDRVHGAR